MTATPAPSGRAWLVNALITVVLWGVWGAFSDQSAKHGFPDTLVYCIWALTMIPPAFIALRMGGNKLELSGKAIAYGMAIGLLGAGGDGFVLCADAGAGLPHFSDHLPVAAGYDRHVLCLAG